MEVLQNMKKIAVLGSSALAIMSGVGVVFAQPPVIEGPTFSPVSADQAGFLISDFGVLLQGLVNLVLFIGALLVFGYLLWGGIQWITSGGDKGKTEEARNKITSAIIGLAVVAASYAVFILALYVIGIENPLTQGLPSQIRLYDTGKE